MYKIFINEKPFIITDSDVKEKRFAACRRADYDKKALGELIKEIEGMKSKGIVLICGDQDAALAEFRSYFVSIEAAGGAVFNQAGDLLLIKRLGKWDLPKGKIDGDESTEHAAIREVMEECGIDELRIVSRLPDSFHTYRMHNHRFLKTTHWFRMTTASTRKPKPQTEEHITEVKWFNRRELRIDELDTYFSIREVLHSLD